MGNINTQRVILGGLAAGAVINFFEFILNGVVLASDWEQAMTALGKQATFDPVSMVVFIIWGFVVGVCSVWLYAAMRPRYGAGSRTAIRAGATIWFLTYVLGSTPILVMNLFPSRMMVLGYIVGVVEAVLGTLLGAYLYKEEPESFGKSAGAAA